MVVTTMPTMIAPIVYDAVALHDTKRAQNTNKALLGFWKTLEAHQAEWARLGMPGTIQMEEEFVHLVKAHVPEWGTVITFGRWDPPEFTSPFANEVGSTESGAAAVLQALSDGERVLMVKPVEAPPPPVPAAPVPAAPVPTAILATEEEDEEEDDADDDGAADLVPTGYRGWAAPAPLAPTAKIKIGRPSGVRGVVARIVFRLWVYLGGTVNVEHGGN